MLIPHLYEFDCFDFDFDDSQLKLVGNNIDITIHDHKTFQREIE